MSLRDSFQKEYQQGEVVVDFEIYDDSEQDQALVTRGNEVFLLQGEKEIQLFVTKLVRDGLWY